MLWTLAACVDFLKDIFKERERKKKANKEWQNDEERWILKVNKEKEDGVKKAK